MMTRPSIIYCYENHNIAIAMSPSRADSVLPWLGVFIYLNQCHCLGWGYLNIVKPSPQTPKPQTLKPKTKGPCVQLSGAQLRLEWKKTITRIVTEI